MCVLIFGPKERYSILTVRVWTVVALLACLRESVVIRLAADFGDIFTDVALDVAGTRYMAKVLNTADDSERGLVEGAHTLLGKAGEAAGGVLGATHDTTLATTAIIERKGARVGLVTTERFRDSLEIAYEHRVEQSDLYMVRPEPLAPREHRWGIAGRIGADGSELLDLDEAALASVAQQIKDADTESVSLSCEARAARGSRRGRGARDTHFHAR
jgi:N-methylhydantoinase A